MFSWPPWRSRTAREIAIGDSLAAAEATALLGLVDLALATAARGGVVVVDRGGWLEGGTGPSPVRVSVTTGATSLSESRSTRTGSGIREAAADKTPGTRTCLMPTSSRLQSTAKSAPLGSRTPKSATASLPE